MSQSIFIWSKANNEKMWIHFNDNKISAYTKSFLILTYWQIGMLKIWIRILQNKTRDPSTWRGYCEQLLRWEIEDNRGR